MHATAHHITLGAVSFKHYVVTGINDIPQNKSPQYGNSTLEKFKTKLRLYEGFKHYASAFMLKTKLTRNVSPKIATLKIQTCFLDPLFILWRIVPLVECLSHEQPGSQMFCKYRLKAIEIPSQRV